MDFQTFHDYNKLARRGLVDPLFCSICGGIEIVIAVHDDEPAIKCYYCGALTIPGLNTYQRIQQEVEKHAIY